MDVGMKTSTAESFGAPDPREDSLDIYDGLDTEPSSSRGKSPPDARQLKESMDLYEEMVTEEQQSRESTYSELMSRFQAAQSQIKDLHKRLEQMELQNSGLNTENYRLKKNISALLQTARQEVTRKDAEIQRLNQRPERSCCHHGPNPGDRGRTWRPSPDVSKTRPLPPTAAPLPPPHPPPHPPPAATPPTASEPARSSRRDSSGCSSTLTAQSSSHSHSRSSSKGSHHGRSHRQRPPHREDRHHGQAEPPQREHGHGKAERSPGRSSSTEEHHRSHRGKSPQLHVLKGMRSHERRPELPPPDSDLCQDPRRSQKEPRSRSSDRREQKRACLKQPCPSERAGERPRKEGGPHTSRRSSSSDRSRNGAGPSSRESHHRKERRSRVHEVSRLSGERGKISVEESSPHRKLCFMETLNLTRSPIKRAGLSTAGGQAPEDQLSPGPGPSEQEEAPRPPGTSPVQSESCGGGPPVPPVPPVPVHHPNPPQPSERLQDVPAHQDGQRTHTSPDSSSSQAERGDGLGTGQGPGTEAGGDGGGSGDGCVSAAEVCVTNSSPENTGEKDEGGGAPTPPLREGSAVTDAPDPAPDPAPPQDHPQPSSPDPAPPQDHPEPSPASGSTQERDSDVVSSTISLDSLPQEGLSLPDAIYILTQSGEAAGDAVSTTDPPGPEAASRISSTTQEVLLLPPPTEPITTPRKSFSPGNSSEPPGLRPPPHDEDSLMRILSNLRRIPDAISPLRSPVHASKRSHPAAHSKPGHVKSLERDFSLTAAEGATKKLDVNKENKHPGSPAKPEAATAVEKRPRPPSDPSDTELEEGEILSESDETATDSPAPAPKRTKLERLVKNKPSPKSACSKTAKERRAASRDAAVPVGLSSHSPKSRFKTVCPAASKSSFSTVDEVMETFRLVRGEIRKKYMKLHKSFPRKSFYGVMDNFQESFLEFVDGAALGTLCSRPAELKARMKKLITSVFSKVSNNGIVKRIFEQQAADLKQKLWDFVDVQVDYLFRDICSTLKLFCSEAEAEGASAEPEPPAEPRQPRPTYKTGLGSRGKDIRILHLDEERRADPPPKGGSDTPAPRPPAPGTPDRTPQNGSLLDKTDFELLTEQQASSLTFNLVRDTQMGEIFKCLLQGTDLLETSGSAWPLGTPRKDGERSAGIGTPSKFESPSSKLDTPSKVMVAWSSVSPHRAQLPLQLHPAVFDESCLLEVPSEIRAQRSYSLLAEDLAVSLTIPSPLKSDSHLSFLRPAVSTPDSVISAHISEDALLDGEDATEQDIHLALDTDNSSGSSHSRASDPPATPFLFKPDRPMQALVMEKSNDHFIVKIRQAHAPPGEEEPSRSLPPSSDGMDQLPGSSQTSPEPQPRPPGSHQPGPDHNGLRCSSDAPTHQNQPDPREEKPPESSPHSERSRTHKSDPEGESLRGPPGQRDAKRKTRQEKPGRKRARKVEERRDEDPESSWSPSSLHAKNVVKKKGEVVMSWTRDEDRAILMELKAKGASRRTFSALSEKLKKPWSQVAHRFDQLMRLYKKQGKVDT